MGLSIKIEGNIQQLDLVALEGYLKSLIAEATGESVARVIYHGVVKSSPEELRKQLQQPSR